MTPEKPLKILFVGSECTPFAKTGGLGDVVAGLSKALRDLGHDARVMIPLYSFIDRQGYGLKLVGSHCIHMGGGAEHWIGLYAAQLDDDVPVWFVEYEKYFGRMGLYDGAQGHYDDNAYRFAMLSKAALQICKDRAWAPDVMHVHDWPSALVPVFLNTWDRILSPLSNSASVLTIHNIGYQGVYPVDVLPYLGIGPEHFNPATMEDHGRVNLLKAGINYADALTTVSPTHAAEILTPEGGRGLAPYLNSRHTDLFGILNGADYEHWNPAADQLLPSHFSAADMTGKAACKTALQTQMKLNVRADVPLFGLVSRFATQKGLDLLRDALPAAMTQMAMQFVVLGNGDAATEDFFRWLQYSFPGRAAAQIGFDNELSHLIEAGSDFFLMPSLYEPCGLNQLYSLRYGTLPIVRATGGLEDTVVNYNETTGEGTGFKFIQPTSLALQNTIGWAVSTWFDRPHHITQLRQQAMAQDFSWPKSAAQYVRVYEHALRNRREATI
jgi:starch synthase